MRSILILAPLALLAACGGGETGGGNGTAAAPVAGATPPAGQQWTQMVSETAEGGYRMGNPDAPVKLVEYGSRTCPACGAFAREGFEPLTKLVETGKVSFEFRDFLIHGAPDVASAVLGRCGGPGTFFPLLEQMYANQNATLDKLQATPADVQARIQNMAPPQQVAAWGEQAGYLDFVKQRGIPEDKARQCLADMELVQKLVGVTENATEVTGTPTFIINGEKVENAVTWPQLETALKKAGA
ncbi:DsbA family protein [Sphingomonas sp.]|uniref:DsbA family protein n=1 Tax=Sphingomonas sp. TaxID=28214 RepID=UPI002CAE5CF3|nr:thioredoxin domain-containing protein [Sphingomonas sp.]HTG38455.1 thioredoxin domain-containing protein [Sphingomonas sp.]